MNNLKEEISKHVSELGNVGSVSSRNMSLQTMPDEWREKADNINKLITKYNIQVPSLRQQKNSFDLIKIFEKIKQSNRSLFSDVSTKSSSHTSSEEGDRSSVTHKNDDNLSPWNVLLQKLQHWLT